VALARQKVLAALEDDAKPTPDQNRQRSRRLVPRPASSRLPRRVHAPLHLDGLRPPRPAGPNEVPDEPAPERIAIGRRLTRLNTGIHCDAVPFPSSTLRCRTADSISPSAIRKDHKLPGRAGPSPIGGDAAERGILQRSAASVAGPAPARENRGV